MDARRAGRLYVASRGVTYPSRSARVLALYSDAVPRCPDRAASPPRVPAATGHPPYRYIRGRRTDRPHYHAHPTQPCIRCGHSRLPVCAPPSPPPPHRVPRPSHPRRPSSSLASFGDRWSALGLTLGTACATPPPPLPPPLPWLPLRATPQRPPGAQPSSTSPRLVTPPMASSPCPPMAFPLLPPAAATALAPL